MMTIGICDDNQKDTIKLFAKLLPILNERVQIINFEGVQSLLSYVKGKNCTGFDLIFIKIDLKEMDTIGKTKEIQESHPNISIIFMSRSARCIEDIFQADPTYFLIKPIAAEKLEYAVTKARRKKAMSYKGALHIDIKGSVYSIPFDEIDYVESKGKNLFVHRKDYTLKTYMKLNQFEELAPCNFLRCHQSYTINMDKIKCLNKEEAILLDGKKVPVSRSRHREAKKRFYSEVYMPMNQYSQAK